MEYKKTMSKMSRLIIVEGIVQGVGFRPFVYRIAKKHNIKGSVKNTGGRVEIIAEGSCGNIESFLHDLELKKPAVSQIYSMESKNIDVNGYKDFTIIKSSTGKTPDSILVPDIGICNKCTQELADPENRRYEYPLISCTECGPRYTLTRTLPYDRQNTSMFDFKPCAVCDDEYTSPADRRFHAQTVCCQECGPELTFTDNTGNILSKGKEAINECAKAINEGMILAIKGYGGFHLSCDAFQTEAVKLLRSRIGRPQQPFAIMAKDIETARQIVHISNEEEKLLLSSKRPVLILDKNEASDYDLEEIAPQLHNIGVMIPYSGIHHMLFKNTSSDAYVMTSANIPGLPMVIDDDIAIRELGHIADNYLLHNLKIENRIDDSVIRTFKDEHVFIRRSRGYVPEPIKLPFEIIPSVGVGAELSNTLIFASGNKAYISPHIGNTNHFETAMYHAEVFNRFSKLTSIEPESWGCDMHPYFNTTKFAMETGGDTVIPVQHHHAHIVSLMADAKLDRDSEIIGIALDGVGYGSDGTVWGGEILHASYTKHSRQGHLRAHAMPGGDLCSYYPERMVISMLRGLVDDCELFALPFELKHGKMEVKMVREQLEKNINVVMSSSSGRVLDAASALLGICKYRSYQGEPAMKLESSARKATERSLELPVTIKDNVFDTGMLLFELYNKLSENEYSIPELAWAYEDAFARGVSEMAVRAAKRTGIDIVGLTGGVAYNEHISYLIRDIIKENDLKFISHSEIPCGDAGVSLGQAIVASLKKEE
ncbi:carbamoyltransferase HypF [Methanolobus sediminis]|uniref:Carbamoyltransferase n=1 Tax=Methanolobus sediminis TaxID=3072978 RepID=A0AA51YLP6_9EURY|nr:carbamoyltransferase HypF [Methanolobus sediminis]WMW25137.1 carbamoyltransferase HypF [Methanolobus sediminis]